MMGSTDRARVSTNGARQKVTHEAPDWATVLELEVRAERAELQVRKHEETLHEIGAAIGGIHAAALLLLLQEARLSDDQTHELDAMLESELERLSRLVRRRPSGESGTLRLDEVITPLVVAQRVCGLDVRWEPTGCRAHGNHDAVAEALHTLLTNAARHGKYAPIEVTTRSYADRVEIRVSDQGPGVDPRLVDTLFDRGAHSAESDGDGLGLYLARRVLLRHDGQLTFEQSRRGATFVITLPPPRPMVPRPRG
jgi:signal transduction histidine kinase